MTPFFICELVQLPSFSEVLWKVLVMSPIGMLYVSGHLISPIHM